MKPEMLKYLNISASNLVSANSHPAPVLHQSHYVRPNTSAFWDWFACNSLDSLQLQYISFINSVILRANVCVGQLVFSFQ